MAVQFLLTFLGIIGLATSLPVTDPSTSLATRSDLTPYLGIYVCPQPHWGGGKQCQWHVVRPEDRAGAGKCISFLQSGGFGSIGPDHGLEVSVYLEAGCPEKSKVAGPKGAPGWVDMAEFYRVDEHPLLRFIARNV